MSRHVKLSLISILCGTFLVSMDQTIVATVLPLIVRDLGGTNWYAWIAAAYILTTTVVLPIAGRLSETRQPRSVYFAGMAIFLLGSGLCAAASTTPELVLARAVQGVGGGSMVAGGNTILGLLFPPRERGRYFGYFGAVIGVSSMVGPLLGGLLAETFSWRAVFLINLPPGLLALAVVWKAMPRDEAARGRFDLPGALTLALWSTPLMLACLLGSAELPLVAGCLALTAVGLLLFVRAERRSPEPLLDLALLRNPTITWACIGLFAVSGFFTGVILFLPLYLVEVRDFSAVQSGLSLLPGTLCAIVSSVALGRLLARLGRYRRLLQLSNAGATAMLLTTWWFFSPTMSVTFVVVSLAMLGLCVGLLMPVYPLVAQNAVDRSRLGTATSLAQFCRQLGSTIFTALMGGLMVGVLHAELPRLVPAGFQVEAFQDEKQLRSQMQEQISLLQSQVARHDVQALRSNPLVPAELKSAPPGDPAWTSLEKRLEAQLDQAFDGAVTAAIRGVYLAAACCAFLAFLSTLFLPDAELRGSGKTGLAEGVVEQPGSGGSDRAPQPGAEGQLLEEQVHRPPADGS